MTAILAFDLETVPDADAGRRLQGLTGSDEEVAAAMLARRLEESKGRTDFLKPAYHRVVGIGAVVLNFGRKVEVRIKQCAGEAEHDLVSMFLDWLRGRPQLVSWNGNGFDLPVIRHRALLHDISAAALYGPADQRQWDSYLYRYGNAHVDLMDVLAGFSASPTHTLDETARLVGLPGKTVATGDQVAGLAAAGEWKRIEEYVGSDAVQTALLFLRWDLGRGRIERGTYLEALTAIKAKVADGGIASAIDVWRRFEQAA